MSKVNTAREEALELLFPEGQVVFAVIEIEEDKDGDSNTEVYTPVYSTRQQAQDYVKVVRDNWLDDNCGYEPTVSMDTEDNYSAFVEGTPITVYICIKELKVNHG